MSPRLLVVALPLLAAAAPPAAREVKGRYWSAPEKRRLDTRAESAFVAGSAADELNRLLARTTRRGAAWLATVRACAYP